MKTSPPIEKFPDDVINALKRGQKIAAIKRLREHYALGLKEAKELVETYPIDEDTNTELSPTVDTKRKIPVLGLLTLAAFTWALVNIVDVIGSLIVMWHHDGYQVKTLTVQKIHYDNDNETGLTWGFVGLLGDREARMYAPRLADAKKLGYAKLRDLYPPGTEIKVWYNPKVTDTLFQHRTLQIIPYTPNIIATELPTLSRWLVLCLLPLVGLWVLGKLTRQSAVI